jgi:hypothetical protein
MQAKVAFGAVEEIESKGFEFLHVVTWRVVAKKLIASCFQGNGLL